MIYGSFLLSRVINLSENLLISLFMYMVVDLCMGPTFRSNLLYELWEEFNIIPKDLTNIYNNQILDSPS
jgi:hypothetical protein